MVMVIECETCQARYRLDRALFKESKAIRVRCRKCGGFIVVANPNALALDEEAPPLAAAAEQPPPGAPSEPPPAPGPGAESPLFASPAASPPKPPSPPPQLPSAPPASFGSGGGPPVSATGPKPTPVRGETPEAETPPLQEEASRAMADLLREIEIAPLRPAPGGPPDLFGPAPGGVPGGKAVPPDRMKTRPAPRDGSEALASALEDLFAKPPPPEPSIPQAPPPKAASLRPPYARPLFLVVAVLWLLLLAVAALLFGTGGSGGGTAKKALSISGSDFSDNTAAGPGYEIRDVAWYTDNAYEGGTLFALTGTVTNVGQAAENGVRIRATLVGKDNVSLSEKEVYAGNRLDNTALRHMKRDVVEEFLTRPPKDGAVNQAIPKGESLPFTVVFFDPPKKIESVLVRPIPAECR